MGNKAHHTSEGLNPLEAARIIRLGIKAVRAKNPRDAVRYERAADKIVENARDRKATQEAEAKAKRAKRKGR